MYNAIIEPIASLLGKVLDVLFVGINAIGLGNIAIAIILFTLLVKLLMLPLTAKQSKMMKLNSIIGPEVRAIQNKYKDKKGDQNAMLKMQEETKAVYAKYGTSQMGGCVQMLIQFPILLALYRVFQRIPMYVTSLKALFINILGDGGNGIMSAADYSDFMSNTFNTGTLAKIDWSNVNDAVVAMNSFTTEQWNLLKEHFTSYASVIADNQAKITEMNTFIGINVSQVPTLALNIAILIPILSGVTQYISVRVSQGKSNQDDSDNPAAASMKMMNIFMPIMSAFIAFSVPAGLGLYWIATAVIQTIIQICINRYYDKLGVDEIVRRNVEQRNKKRAKKGLPPEKIAKNATTSTKKIDSQTKSQERIDKLQQKKEQNDKKVKEILEATNYYKSAKPGSLAEKAGMVAKYNEKNSKKN
ncbi:YidC/Oxa1 family membrane protein insertase [Lachnospira hominis (ex Hitch et al. 2024)]|jgi:YidC/Oxa1 family membrane protein insertase|uniref:YidC/Oxa1 family membrane protein insertase n=1 Tax=Lachnospira intestinalis TaxID=3133158 RepID=A0ABV1GRQ0_9FIRM